MCVSWGDERRGGRERQKERIIEKKVKEGKTMMRNFSSRWTQKKCRNMEEGREERGWYEGRKEGE